MANIVKLKHPRYGDIELNVDRVIAVVPESHQLLFEDVYWPLESEEFDKVYEVWNKQK